MKLVTLEKHMNEVNRTCKVVGPDSETRTYCGFEFYVYQDCTETWAINLGGDKIGATTTSGFVSKQAAIGWVTQRIDENL